ncbi:MAG: preprotein translocase subunit YajC [Gammaproteobacteria bacterium]|nr:preprotein translocase subunit YajC [Gammaproteobacteria bacterium]
MIPFESVAYAQETGARGLGPFDLLLLVGFVAIFYFLLWRPQSKRRKEHQALMASLSRGDEVVTAGGIMGQVTKVEDDFVMLRVANNLELRLQKSAVGSTLPKGTLKALDEK